MDNKLCPFNNMKPCIKEECAMYLDINSVTINGKTGVGNIFEYMDLLPCIFIVQGHKAASDLAYDFVKSKIEKTIPPPPDFS